MRLVPFLVRRGYSSNRLRAALTVLGIALGIAIVVAIHVVDHNTIKSRLLEQRPDFGRVDLELMPLLPRPPEDVRLELAARSDVQAVGLLHQALAALRVGGAPAGTASVYGLSPLPSVAFQHYRLEQGEDLSDLDGDRFVLVARELATARGIQVGDWIELAPASALQRARCKAGERVPLAAPPESDASPRSVQVKGIVAHERLGRRDLGEVVLAPFGLARLLQPGGTTVYQLNRKRGAGADRLRADLRARYQVLDQRSALLGEAADERAFRNGVKVLGCLALVLGMFVVFQTLSHSLVERMRQIGLLRSLGASRRAVGAAFLLDAGVMAAAGAVLGVLLGLLIAWILQSLRVTTLGVGKSIFGFGVPVGPVLWTAALGVLFTLAGAAFPLWKARNLSPLRVLSPHGIDDAGVLRGVNLFLFFLLVLVLPGAYLAMTPLYGEGERETLLVLGQLGGMILLFGGVLLLAPRTVRAAGRALLLPLRARLRLPCFLADKALQHGPGRFASGVCGLAVVLLALVALKHITHGLHGEVRQFAAVALRDRLFVQGPPMPAARARQLAAVPGVRAVAALQGSVQPSFLLSGLDLDLPGYAGDQRVLVASRRLATLRGWKADDFVPVLTDEGPVPYRVLAVRDDLGFFPDERAWAVTAPRWMQHDFCVGKDCVSSVSLALEPGADPDQTYERVKAALPAIGWGKSGDWLLAYYLRDVTRDFFLFDVLLGLILAIATIGLINGQTIAALARAREIGVLRALGVSAGQLRAQFLLEGGVVGCLAAALALGLSIPLGALVIAGLNRVAGIEAPVVVPWAWFAIAAGLAAAVGLGSAVIPGLRAVRERPAEAVRYE
jgi:putative ABC transport system permease protein